MQQTSRGNSTIEFSFVAHQLRYVGNCGVLYRTSTTEELYSDFKNNLEERELLLLFIRKKLSLNLK